MSNSRPSARCSRPVRPRLAPERRHAQARTQSNTTVSCPVAAQSFSRLASDSFFPDNAHCAYRQAARVSDERTPSNSNNGHKNASCLPRATTRCLPLPARPRSRTHKNQTALNDARDKDYDYEYVNADGHDTENTLCGFARRRAEGVAAAFPLGCTRTTTRLGGRRGAAAISRFFFYYIPYFSKMTPL